MEASILFLVSSSSLEKRVSRTREKDTADSGTTLDERTGSYAPVKENNRRILALFFCRQFLNLLFSNFVPLRFRN
jgi:hypothetical protein